MNDMKKSTTVKKVAEGYLTRLRFGKGQRRRFVIKLQDESAAEIRAEALQALANLLAKAGKQADAPIILRKGADVQSESDFQNIVEYVEGLCERKVPAKTLTARLTFKELGQKWERGELHRDWPDHVKIKRSVYTDRSRLTRLYDTIGNVTIATFRLEDAERAMKALPSELSSASRRQYAQLISKVLRLAVYPCKLIERSPLPIGFLPTVRAQKITAYLYPDEDTKLMACEAVPRLHRLLYGLLAREGLRLGEALSLRWKDIDLDRGVIALDENKTDDPRAWALSPGVATALARFEPRDVNPKALVFAGIEANRAAETFREHLKAAGVKRGELFEDSKTRRQIRLHDLRATFVTLALANGRSESWVSDRTGHRSSVMINHYKRQARQAQELGFPALVPLEKAMNLAHPVGPQGGPTKNAENCEISIISAVPRVGIEPTTRGFSVHCSTN